MSGKVYFPNVRFLVGRGYIRVNITEAPPQTKIFLLPFRLLDHATAIASMVLKTPNISQQVGENIVQRKLLWVKWPLKEKRGGESISLPIEPTP